MFRRGTARDLANCRVWDLHSGAASAVLKVISQAELLLELRTAARELAREGIDAKIAVLALKGIAAYLDRDDSRAADLLTAAAARMRTRLLV